MWRTVLACSPISRARSRGPGSISISSTWQPGIGWCSERPTSRPSARRWTPRAELAGPPREHEDRATGLQFERVHAVVEECRRCASAILEAQQELDPPVPKVDPLDRSLAGV